jgi:hypothetical protein
MNKPFEIANPSFSDIALDRQIEFGINDWAVEGKSGHVYVGQTADTSLGNCRSNTIFNKEAHSHETKHLRKCLALIKSLLGHYLPLSTGIIPVSRIRKNSPLKRFASDFNEAC